MSAGNDDLHRYFDALLEGFRDLEERLQEAKGELRKIREAVVSGASNIQEAIYDSIEARAELKMMEHMMDARAIRPQIEAEQERLRRERAELDDRLEQIGERFRERHDELDQKAARRIRNLGSHIFEIEEDQFEEGIEEPFVRHVTPTWRDLRIHNEQKITDRRYRVEQTAGSTVQEIHEFIDRQEELLDEIDRYQHRDERLAVDGDDPAPIQIPYYVVEYDRGSGHKMRTAIAPSVASVDDGYEWSRLQLESIDGAFQLTDTEPQLQRSGGRTRSLGAGKIRATLDGYSTGRGLLSYHDEVAKTVDGSVQVHVQEDE